MRLILFFAFLLAAAPSFAQAKCAAPLYRAYTIVTDPAAVSRFDCIIGALDIRADGEVALPALRMIYGALIVRNTRLQGFSAPALEEVNGSLFIELNPNLTGVNLPKLGSLNGVHRIQGNPALEALTLKALGAINGKLDVFGNDGLMSLDLHALGGVNGSLRIWENGNLELLGLRSFKALHGAFVVRRNPRLPEAPLLVLANDLKKKSRLARVKIAENKK